MSDSHSHAQHIARHVRIYLTVFIALLVGTVVTVGMYYVRLESVPLTITIAVFIATVKASLVAGFFMHLVSEKKVIYAILIFTAFFFAALMAMLVWSLSDTPELTTTSTETPAAVSVPAPHVP